MIIAISKDIYFGNWESPLELPGVRSIINVAHSFSARRGRNLYWANLERVPWTTLYFRFARKDGQAVDDTYMACLTSAVMSIAASNAFPLLTHCQMGGHRGPTAAMFAFWCLNGQSKDALQEGFNRIKSVRPGFGEGRNKDYHESLYQWCERQCR